MSHIAASLSVDEQVEILNALANRHGPSLRSNVVVVRNAHVDRFKELLVAARAECFPQRTDEQLAQAAGFIERSCFEAALQQLQLSEACCDTSPTFAPVYATVTYVLLSNMHDSLRTNKDLFHRMPGNAGFIKALGSLSERELNPEPTQAIQDLVDQQNNAEQIVPKTTLTYPCPKCGGPTRSQGRQTRGLDEQQTIFVFCIPCNFEFRR